MSVKLIPLCAAAGLTLLGCGSVTSEQMTTITVNDRSYPLRTRTLDGPGGSYQTSSVRVRGKYFTCIPESPGDCAAAISRGQSTLSDRN